MRRLGIARNIVRAALASDTPPEYRRPLKGSIVNAVEPQIQTLLSDYLRMPATVIAERIGWERSLTVLKERVSELRPLFLPAGRVAREAFACRAISIPGPMPARTASSRAVDAVE